jgi:sugar (pentulose or hexulose) kinase
MVFCGLDIGTTHTKAVLLDRDGFLLDTIQLPARAETDWYGHFCQVLDYFSSKGHFDGNEIVCSVTGQGGSFVLLDDRYLPVSEPHCWTDLAEEAVVQDLIDTLGMQDFYQLTGWPPHGWLAACKLRQIVAQRAMPTGARYIATVPDAIYAHLTGHFVTDITSAQITGLANFQQGNWSPAILAWVGIKPESLPVIETRLKVLFDRIDTPWGRLTLVIGSHDQYAAMQAAGLEPEQSVMLGTGTAWVINGRMKHPIFDNDTFRIHPGRDVMPGRFGTITTLWQIGAGFDQLCGRLGVQRDCFTQGIDLAEPPDESIEVDVDTGSIHPACPAPERYRAYTGTVAVQRYMEWAASIVRSALERTGWLLSLDRMVVTGGAMASRLWPQIIADVCGITLDAVDFPAFTAWGAASHAMMAKEVTPAQALPAAKQTLCRYEPERTEPYERWYQQHQRNVVEGLA